MTPEEATTPEALPGIETVAGVLKEFIPQLHDVAANAMAQTILKHLTDDGWRPHNKPSGVRPPMTMIRRWVLYDAFADPTTEEVAGLLGLPPISADVSEMERKASYRRLERLGRLGEGVEDHASLFANIFVGLNQRQHMATPDAPVVPEEYWDKARKMHAHMFNVTCMSLLSLLHGLDIIEEGKGEKLHGI